MCGVSVCKVCVPVCLSLSLSVSYKLFPSSPGSKTHLIGSESVFDHVVRDVCTEDGVCESLMSSKFGTFKKFKARFWPWLEPFFRQEYSKSFEWSTTDYT